MADATTMAAELIQHYESCRLAPYLDARGTPTIGWGNTVWQDGTRVSMDDQPVTQPEADALFTFWLAKFGNNVAKNTPGILEYELAAFTSLAYNIGMGAFTQSTALREYLLSNKTLAGNAIELWDRAGNHVLKGLQRRRRAEHLVFEGQVPATAIAQAEKDFP